jgi:hypothetical protein
LHLGRSQGGSGGVEGGGYGGQGGSNGGGTRKQKRRKRKRQELWNVFYGDDGSGGEEEWEEPGDADGTHRRTRSHPLEIPPGEMNPFIRREWSLRNLRQTTTANAKVRAAKATAGAAAATADFSEEDITGTGTLHAVKPSA